MTTRILAQFESDVAVSLLHQLDAQEEILFVLGTCFNLFACMRAKLLQSRLTLCNPMSYHSPPDSSLHMGFPSKNTGAGCCFLFWESSQARDQTRVSGIFCIGRRVLYHWTTWKAQMIRVWCSRWRGPGADQPVKSCSSLSCLQAWFSVQLLLMWATLTGGQGNWGSLTKWWLVILLSQSGCTSLACRWRVKEVFILAKMSSRLPSS